MLQLSRLSLPFEAFILVIIVSQEKHLPPHGDRLADNAQYTTCFVVLTQDVCEYGIYVHVYSCMCENDTFFLFSCNARPLRRRKGGSETVTEIEKECEGEG
jgi:hypothetical protein